jgi:hypothetical protein
MSKLDLLKLLEHSYSESERVTLKLRHREVKSRLWRELRPRGFVKVTDTTYAEEFNGARYFVNLHKFSGATHFRIHCGIEPLRMNWKVPVLNGPSSDSWLTYSERIELLSYGLGPEAVASCLSGMLLFIDEVYSPWRNAPDSRAELAKVIAWNAQRSESKKMD